MSTQPKDPYQVLGVAKSADTQTLRGAYRKLAREFHPDVNPGDRAAEERFKEVTSAYGILSDAKKRALYDEFGAVGLREGFNAEQARAYGRAGGMGGQGFGGQGPQGFDLGDLFGDLFGGGGGGGRRPRRARGGDLQAVVEVSLVDALRGTEVTFDLQRQVGMAGAGGGQVTVRIPPGIATGDKLRVAGRGLPGTDGAGDLIIETKLTPHPFYTREGLDLTVELPVTLVEAFRGATVSVPTAAGSVKLKIPPKTPEGGRLRVRGKGVSRSGRTGDLFVIVRLQLPDGSDEAVETALKALEPTYVRDVRADFRL